MTIDDPGSVLATAGIGLERQGKERLRTLTEGERAFYRWVLRSFAAGTPPGPDELADTASALELEVEPALERLAGADLVHHDPATGAIVVACPFSGRPTLHRVRLQGGEVYAMCAIDALGIAPMLGEPIEIASRDPLTDDDIQVASSPAGAAGGSLRRQSSSVAGPEAGSPVMPAVRC